MDNPYLYNDDLIKMFDVHSFSSIKQFSALRNSDFWLLISLVHILGDKAPYRATVPGLLDPGT